MHKEPNGTLVMTTCKCRENTKNLVMTRTWFEEQLQNKIAWGAKQEQKRIIELLEQSQITSVEIMDSDFEPREIKVRCESVRADLLIALIKGENK